MTAKFVINDGQHRRAANERALAANFRSVAINYSAHIDKLENSSSQ